MHLRPGHILQSGDGGSFCFYITQWNFCEVSIIEPGFDGRKSHFGPCTVAIYSADTKRHPLQSPWMSIAFFNSFPYFCSVLHPNAIYISSDNTIVRAFIWKPLSKMIAKGRKVNSSFIVKMSPTHK